MIFPILGIISFQSYWLMRTYKINEERFEKDINSCLQDALESDITSQTANKIPQLDSTLKSIDIHSNGFDPGKDAEMDELMSILANNDSSQDDNISIHFMGIDGDSTGLLPFEALTDSMTLYGDTSIIINSNRGLDMEQSWKELILKIIADMVDYQAEFQPIDSIYKEKLKERGIESDYLLAIFKDGKIYDSNANDSSIFIKYDAKIIIGKVLEGSSELRAVFPQKTGYLLRSMWISLLSSLLLTIAIIGTFIYMLIVIFMQKKLSDMKSDFISNMTHEFKTPIATVSAAIESMQNFGVLDDKEKTNSYLNISKKELHRLNSMVEKVLDISAYEKQKVSLNKEEVFLADTIEEVADRFRFQKTEVIISTHLDKQVSIWADRMHFGNLINNLLDNAIKYCDQKAEIEIHFEKKAKEAIIRIKDNGIGISKDHQKLIFDQFYRVPNNHIHTVKGFGLGLNYVQHVVAQHEGQLGLKSKLGEGSEFTIQLPIYNESL